MPPRSCPARIVAVAAALAAAGTLVPLTPVGAGPASVIDAPCGWATGPAPAHLDHVVWIIYENKTWNQIFTSGDAPYIHGLADRCGRADGMNHVYPKSLANYIALTSGITGGITSDRAPSVWPQAQVSLFQQLGAGNWRELNETMPSNCYLKGAGDFSVNHAPAQYYTAIRSQCADQSVPLGATPDISAPFTLIIPNKVHDMHRTDVTPTIQDRIRAGDEWTSQIVPQFLASPEYQAGTTAIFLTWDEANSKTTRIPFVAISPFTAPGTVSTTTFTHYSLLKATEEMLGISDFLAHAGDADTVSIRADFGLS
jgi:phosphatidylinositol-3-phosphatase